MNKQEIFDKVATHLLTQGKQAIYEGVCQYRTPDDAKCAAGCLIPDEVYEPRMEGNLITTIVAGIPINGELVKFALPSFFELNLDFIRQLQGIHDANDVPGWFDRLRTLADSHELSTDTLIAVAARVTGERLHS